MKYYYEVVGSNGSDTGPYGWKVYHWDPTGNLEIVDMREGLIFKTKEKALDAACEWMEDNNIDAELM